MLLAIELDGVTHIYEDSVEKDKKREDRLRSFGITILRFEDSYIFKHIDWVIEEIDETVIKLMNEIPTS